MRIYLAGTLVIDFRHNVMLDGNARRLLSYHFLFPQSPFSRTELKFFEDCVERYRKDNQ